MKEPELTLAGAEADYDDQAAIPGREPVSGGKALARLLDFQVRRGVAEAPGPEGGKLDTARVAPGVLCGESVISGGPPTAMAAPGAPPGKPRSTYLTAFRQLGTSAQPAGGFLGVAMPVPRAWQPLGPFSIPHGQSYGAGPESRPPVAGRVSAVAVDPGDDEHLLIGAAGGGVWESHDRGESWHPRTDDQASLSIGALAFDPSDRFIVYAGTGEGDTFSWLGVGLLRSTDGGTTWDLLPEPQFQGVSFFDLVVDPLDGQRLLAATSNGLFESTNSGTTWERRRSATTWSVSIQPADPADAGATREVLAGCEDGVFRSTVGSANWQGVALSGLPASPERIEVCHAPSAREVVYVVAAGPPEVPDPLDPTRTMPRPYLWRRSSATTGFSPFTAPPTLQTGQAFYDWFAAVAPDDEDVLYVGGINVHKGERSASGNWSWENISARTVGSSIHPDQHVIAFSPADPSTIYVGNDGGIYTSGNGGTTWRSLNKGLAITEFEFLAQHARFDAWLIAGTQDNGTLRYEGQELWYHVQDGDGGDCGASETSPYTCFHTFYGMGMERSITGGGWDSWKWVGPNVPKSENYRSGALFYPPVEVRDTVVAQAGRSVWISSQSGEPGSWLKRRLPPAAGRASALAIPHTDRIYVGTERGHVYRIDRINGIWRKPEALTFPTDRFLSDLLVDPTDPDRLWVTCSDLSQPGVFRSDDGGATWDPMSAGLPAIPINAVEIDPTSPDTVFVAADVGVYRSLDAGQTWTPFSEGLPNALVQDLLFHAPSRLLRAATQSRGVWEIAVDQAIIPEVEVFMRDSVVDTGRRVPSPSGVDDPFQPGLKANWWHCPDIKVDASPFHSAALDDVDFESFGDDRDLIDDGHQFATGLRHNAPVRGQTSRLYVQVHNRGVTSAQRVAVKVFFTGLVDHLPDLEADFWDGFPDNSPSSSSAWQPVAGHVEIPEIEPGRSAVVGFEWQVPAGVADPVALLAAVSADNDTLDTQETRVAVLAPGNTKCGLKIVAVEG